MDSLELLAPAGSMEALRAAVQNGADAVYLGAGSMNARMGARNFSVEELQEAVSYCRVRGVQVHLTLNTLVTDRELAQAAELIRTAARCGVDAFIVQDPGIVTLCRQTAPDVAVHASTQMSVHSLDGVRAAASLGCSRVVLARELSAAEIAAICAASPVEIEVFGHGALCMCCSGQCYLSGVIGRRSGNRGQCAQPCRLPYGYDRFENKYPLSLKDNCLVQHLDSLQAMGVNSLKLEGRMKRPEYVAIVTRIYRAALDGHPPGPADLQELEAAFSRDGFTDGYYTGRKGRSMYGIHRDEDRASRELLAAARRTWEAGESQRVPVHFSASVQAGEPAWLSVEDDRGNVCRAAGPVPAAGVNRSLTQEELAQRLHHTGGTPYYMQSCSLDVAPGLNLTAAQINALRREALQQLTAVRGRVETPRLLKAADPPRVSAGRNKAALTVSVHRADQLTAAVARAHPAVLYAPLDVIAAAPEKIARMAARTEVCAVVPRVIRDGEMTQLSLQLQQAAALGIRSVLSGNIGHSLRLAELGFTVRGDYGLNVFNSRTLQVLQAQGLVSATASFELTLAQIRDLSRLLPTEILIYGRLPLMLTDNCIIYGRTGGCTCGSGSVRLVDRRGADFPILRDCGTCRTELQNGKKLYLLDKRRELDRLGLWALRLRFTTENPAEVDAVMAAWTGGSGQFEPGTCTRGLYVRGVE